MEQLILRDLESEPPCFQTQANTVAAKLSFKCTNNMAEYEACVLGLRLALDMNVKDFQLQITHRNSTAYRLQMNGAVKAAKKNSKKILRKMIDNYKDWHEQLPYELLGYRTTARTLTKATLYLLVYGTDAVIPAQVEILSLQIIQEAELSDAKWIHKRYEQMALIDEKRMIAIFHGQLYQQRMTRAFNKRVRTRVFQIGQLILKRIFPNQEEYKGKFAPNWHRPYMIRKVLSGGVVMLAKMDGQEWPKAIQMPSKDTTCEEEDDCEDFEFP
ncbi:uncharacterized protein LOC132631063 [Lycium barbarum]|uniref:uncharacterized protein LOC132631063 n=1 Tax=Lycium barbarum TaxID=112863 RepID=UPI00293EEA49|nr:uncharacterized protein LOC132631063 [Lycium barbarum]